ncbi:MULTISPECIES: hypothetical protein [unclassified Micromonospora]|uniref:hypothetical protein n=1 Tax=unclassified Micromonospora TaxID=2617518 RepID=UPI001C5E8D97|nr:hypothetical protein [Micromonospora sp. RL09-050-HVF-A]MBW4704729.1 hypothetical protein [Micromonospora sp. RL09-050-HVF-A]
MKPAPSRPGNQTDGSGRQLLVTHDDELERALRETLSQRVAVPHRLPVDPAGLALGRARRVRRRRTVAGLTLASIVTALAAGGMTQLGGQADQPTAPTVVLGDPQGVATLSPDPVAPHPADRPTDGEVDLIVAGALVTAAGQRYELGIGPVERAQRLPDRGGWLLTGAVTAAGRTLWVVPSGGKPQALLAGADEIVLSPDSRQVAWRDDGRLFAAGIVAGQLIASVAGPSVDAVPVRVVGDRVLLRAAPEGGHLWWRWSPAGPPGIVAPDVQEVYGTRPDGRLVARVRVGSGSCLALLDPDLAPASTRCDVTPTADGRGAVSPDGRWLLVNGRLAGSDDAILVDLAGTVPAPRGAGPAIGGAVVWTDDHDAAYVDGDGDLARVRPDEVLADRPATPTPVAGAGADARPVVVAGTG